MSENGDFSAIWNDAIQNTVAGMSDPDLAKMGLARLQATPAPAALQLPADDVAHRIQANRNSIGAKASQLWEITQQCTDGGGYTGGIADAAAVHGGVKYPQPQQQSDPAPTTGFAQNRGQSSGGSDWAPVSEADINRDKIARIRERGL